MAIMVRQLARPSTLVLLVSAWLGATASACSKQPAQASPSLTAAQASVDTFRFAPPDGTEFVRYDRHRQELAVLGTPLRMIDEDELRWNVAISRRGDRYFAKQDLAHIVLKRDGIVVLDSDVKKPISAELVLDANGRLLEVRGLDKTAASLRDLATPDKRAAIERILTPKYLADLVTARYRVFFGETVGRPAQVGQSWTMNNDPASLVRSRKMTVERYEACDGTTCARLRMDFDVNPEVLAKRALELMKAHAGAGGSEAANVNVRNATYGMSGAMLVEPATMLGHGASVREHGTVTLAGSENEELTVEQTGTTEISYAYGTRPVALRE